MFEHSLKNAYIGEYVETPFTPTANTILYMPLEDSINDVTWNYTISQSWTVSKWSIGYSFNYWRLQTSTSFAWPTAWTISAWVKQTSRNNNSCVAAKFQTAAPYNFLCIKYSTTDSLTKEWRNNGYIIPEYSMSGGSNPIWVPYLTEQPLNTWLHLVITHGSSGSKFYINSTLVASDSNTANLLTTSSPFVVWSNIQYNQYFLGEISDVIYESVQRTAQEVLDYYNASKWTYGL